MWQDVQEAKGDFISDWEDDFDDIDEAYSEQGRNEAEHQVINGIISVGVHGFPLLSDDHCKLFNQLAKHYELEI